jgi:hypothetical protein
MSNTQFTVFSDAIGNVIDELPQGKPAPDHTVSRRIDKSRPRDQDVCSPKTAESAAARPGKHKRDQDRQALYDFFCAIGPQGATRETAMEAVGLHTNSGYPRCFELLRDKRLVRISGERRKTRQGNWAAILCADIYAETP